MVDQNKVNLQLEDPADVDFGDIDHDFVDHINPVSKPQGSIENPQS